MIKLTIKESEITQGGELLIKKMAIIDHATGEILKLASISEELRLFLMSCEIDLTDYAQFVAMKEKNPALKKMVNDFNLILTARGGATR